MPDSSPPPVPSPSKNPVESKRSSGPWPSPTATPDKARYGSCSGCFKARTAEDFACSLTHCRRCIADADAVHARNVPPSAPPAPAPGEFDLDEMERLAREESQEGERHAIAEKLLADGYSPAFARFVAFCTPARVTQLVGVARTSAPLTADEIDALRSVWSTAWEFSDERGDEFDTAHLAIGKVAARASRPTEETDDA